MGDEFPRRLCDPLPPVTAVLYHRWLAAGLHDKMISQGEGGHRVYVGICHPSFIFPQLLMFAWAAPCVTLMVGQKKTTVSFGASQ